MAYINITNEYLITANGTLYLGGGGDANCTLSVCPVEISIYGYRPSLPTSSVLIALYGLSIIIQAVLAFRFPRWWGYTLATCLAAVSEIIGYAGRVMLYQNPWNYNGFIIQIVLITFAPVFYSAAIYVMLYHIILYISPEASRFPPRWVYYIFIVCDIISLALQAAGGALSSTSNGSDNGGVSIAKAGLSFQVATLIIFAILTLDYMFKSRSIWRQQQWPRRFKSFLFFLALSVILILIRCCYRVYELKDGYSSNSSSLRDQSLFNGLEAAMVVIAAYTMIAAHPGFGFKEKPTPGPRAAEEKIEA